MSSLTFPIMNTRAIQNSLASINISTNEDMLKKPNSALVHTLFRRLVENTSGVIVEINSSDFTQERPQFRESFFQVSFLNQLIKICQASGINDFEPLRDLENPTPRRLTYILSGLINFGKFKTESLKQKFAQSQNTMEEVIALYDDSQDELEKTTQHFDHLQAEKIRLAPEIEALKKENAILNDEMLKYQEDHERDTIEAEKIKNQVKQLNEQVNRQKDILEKKQQDNLRLSEQIVENPDQINENKKKQAEQEKIEKATVQELEDKYEELQKRMNSLEKLDKEIDKCLDTLLSATNEFAKCNAMKNENRGLKDAITKIEQEMRDIEREIKHFNNCLSSVSEKELRFSQETAELFDKYNQRIEEEKLAKPIRDAEITELKTITDVHKSKCKAYLDAIEKGQKAHSDDLNLMYSKWTVFYDKVKEYHNTLESQMTLISKIPI